MSNANLVKACTFDGNVNEIVGGGTMSLAGAPGYANMIDGSQGMLFDNAAWKVAQQTGLSLTPSNVGMLACRFRAQKDFDASATGVHYLCSLRGASTANAIRLILNYTDAGKGVQALFASSVSGSNLSTVLSWPNFNLANGEECHIAVYWWVDPNDTAGNCAVVLALNGRLLGPPLGGELLQNRIPADIDRWVIGGSEASSGLAAVSIIQDAVYKIYQMQPREFRELASGRFDVAAKDDQTIYQPTYAVDGYSAPTDLHPYYPKAIDRQGRLLALKETGSQTWATLARSTNEAGTSWEDIDTPDEGTSSSVWLHDGENGEREKYISVGTLGKVWRAVYADWPNLDWEEVEELTEADTQIVNGWGHATWRNHVWLAEYKVNTTVGHRLLWSSDAGATYTTLWTLPATGNASIRHHFHGINFDRLRRVLEGNTGDAADTFFRWHLDTETFEFILGNADHTINSANQGTPVLVRPRLDFHTRIDGSDSGNQPGLTILIEEEDVHPWEGTATAAWSKRMSIANLVAGKYLTTCFGLERLNNGTIFSQTTAEGSATQAIWFSTPDGLVSVRAADLGTNLNHSAVNTPSYFIWGRWRFDQGVTINGETMDMPVDGAGGAVLDAFGFGWGY